jgi:hypothetical protein
LSISEHDEKSSPPPLDVLPQADNLTSMKYLFLITLSLLTFGFNLKTAKPASAGKPSTQETVQNHPDEQHTGSEAVKPKERKEKKTKQSDDDEPKNTDDDKSEKSKDKANNSDKTDVERKEADKGSETGQQKREEHSLK